VLSPDWRAHLRAAVALPPEAALLAPARTVPGNAAAVLWRSPTTRAVTAERMVRGIPLTAEDSVALAAALRDTALDAVRRAATMRDYDPTLLALRDSGAGGEIFGVPLPSLLGRVRGASEELLLRGVGRARQGCLADARADLEAVIGIGLMRFAREPTTQGALAGARSAALAATVLASLAPRDTLTSHAAARLEVWLANYASGLRGAWGDWFGLFSNTDSSLAAVSDTSLPFPIRAEGLFSGSIGSVVQGPWSAWLGPRRSVVRAVRAAEHSSDPDLAMLAVAADTALARIGRVGAWRRLHYLHTGR